MTPKPKLTFAELEDAYRWADAGDPGFAAWICRTTGKVYLQDESGATDMGEPLPEAIDDEARYVQVPDARDPDLGTALVFDFAARHMPGDYDDVRQIFRKRGAYGRFRSLVERNGQLQAWYDFQEEATAKALRDWAAENGLEVTD
ncbi:hypothetical protein [Pseudomonas lopnurensis]|uniref:hypothetical protein n=1 Tax=Pseudomonas lopnurensis TaxID=1477517 RepID=UPI0028A9329A|nr:hypothetical protein [Pseudomonas lopnurensis]